MCMSFDHPHLCFFPRMSSLHLSWHPFVPTVGAFFFLIKYQFDENYPNKQDCVSTNESGDDSETVRKQSSNWFN